MIYRYATGAQSPTPILDPSVPQAAPGAGRRSQMLHSLPKSSQARRRHQQSSNPHPHVIVLVVAGGFKEHVNSDRVDA
eukprot:7966486-Pyramimonas_sp.AAC.1